MPAPAFAPSEQMLPSKLCKMLPVLQPLRLTSHLWYAQVKDIINQAAQTIGLNLNILDHNNLVSSVTCDNSAFHGNQSKATHMHGKDWYLPCQWLESARSGMQEAAARFFANPTMLAAILITTAVLELQEQQLTLNVEVQVIGNVAQGRIDYLIKGPQVCTQDSSSPSLSISDIHRQRS